MRMSEVHWKHTSVAGAGRAVNCIPLEGQQKPKKLFQHHHAGLPRPSEPEAPKDLEIGSKENRCRTLSCGSGTRFSSVSSSAIPVAKDRVTSRLSSPDQIP